MSQNQFKPVQPGQLSETLAQNEKGKGLAVIARGRALVELVQGSVPSTGKKGRGDRESASYPPGHPCLCPTGEKPCYSSGMLWECGDSPHSLGKSSLRAEGVVLCSASSEDTPPPLPWGELCKNKRAPSQAWWWTLVIQCLGH